MASSKSNNVPSPNDSKKDLAAAEAAEKMKAKPTPKVVPQFEATLAPHMDEFELLNDREFKAHLYQQIFELQPYFTSDSQVSVELDQENLTDEVSLTLSTTWGGNRVDVKGRGDDVYTALTDAKSNLLRQIEEWYGEAIDSRVRDAEIRAIQDGSLLVH